MLTLFGILFLALVGSTALFAATVHYEAIGDRFEDMVRDDTRTLGQTLAIGYAVPGAFVFLLVLWLHGELRPGQFKAIARDILVAPFRDPAA